MIHPIRRQHLFGLALILLVAGLLRFGNLDSSAYDQAGNAAPWVDIPLAAAG